MLCGISCLISSAAKPGAAAAARTSLTGPGSALSGLPAAPAPLSLPGVGVSPCHWYCRCCPGLLLLLLHLLRLLLASSAPSCFARFASGTFVCHISRVPVQQRGEGGREEGVRAAGERSFSPGAAGEEVRGFGAPWRSDTDEAPLLLLLLRRRQSPRNCVCLFITAVPVPPAPSYQRQGARNKRALHPVRTFTIKGYVKNIYYNT